MDLLFKGPGFAVAEAQLLRHQLTLLSHLFFLGFLLFEGLCPLCYVLSLSGYRVNPSPCLFIFKFYFKCRAVKISLTPRAK